MNKILDYLKSKNIKIDVNKVTCLAFNNAVIYLHNDNGLRVNIEPHDVKHNFNVNVEQVIGDNPYKHNL
ncbi:hypothetical protein JR311_20130 (plasmid) [Bacillus velezensis]|uniref:hypothetical protein n=1 Tax=Bacillus velezensis TaxID=492670 RepID=UPI00195B5EAC|nr:hypothetical protein [Bacillus velezensis]QRV11335.1 hypothetical protein JR311_20130 [Bacillus velezensis]URJ76400.1 hypothetical protein MF619_004145 [Bacillus velezensis]URJ80356.1 hypothetical protein MF621_004107 [Bacillus velezensis]